MSTEFVTTLKATGGDYTSIVTWETANQCDLTNAKVFSISGTTGTVADDATVTGSISSATGTVVHVNAADDQILIEGISGTFQSGENFEVDGSNYVTSTDAGDDPIVTLACDSESETVASFLIDGWLGQSAAKFLRIRAAVGHEHKGIPGNGYKLSANNASWALRCNERYSEFYDIEIENITTGDNRQAIRPDQLDNKIHRCILKTTTTSGSHVMRIEHDGSEVYNCFIHGGVNGIDASYSGVDEDNIYINGNTIVGCTGIGVYATGAIIDLQNNVCYNNTGDDFDITTATNNFNNASEDLTAPGTSSITGIGTGDFLDTTSSNYRPDPAGSLYGAGKDLSGTFTDDCRAETRTVWSIGAFDHEEIIRTVKTSGGDYTSLSGWESGEQRDMTNEHDNAVAECYAMADSGGVYFDGWTFPVNTDRSIKARAAAGEQFTKDGSDGYRLSGTNWVFRIGVNQVVHAKGLAIKNLNTTSGDAACVYYGNVDRGTQLIRLEQLYLHMVNNTAAGDNVGIYCNCTSVGTSFEIFNCVISDIRYVNFPTSTGQRCLYPRFGDNFKVYNCTFHNSWYGIYRNGESNTTDVKNCISTCSEINASAEDFRWGGSTVTGNNNFSADSSAPGTSPTTGITSANNYKPSTGDYRIKDSNADIFDGGADLSATFTTDIRGLTRKLAGSDKASSFDAGAFRSVANVTHTIKTSGGDYTTMADWEPGEQRDLVALDENEILECDAIEDALGAARVSVSGWDVDLTSAAANNITIKAAAGAEHDGVVDGGYNLTGSYSFGATLQIVEFGTIIQDIQVENTHAVQGAVLLSSAKYSKALRVLINDAGTEYGIKNSGLDYIEIDNCLLLNCAGIGISTTAHAGLGVIYRNNTVIGAGTYGIYKLANDAPTYHNNVVYGSGTADYATTDAIPTGSYNADSDGTAYGTNPINNITTGAFESYGTGDYRPANGGVLHDIAGATSGAADDITRTTRTENDIGCWIAAGAAAGGVTFNGVSISKYCGQAITKLNGV
jgi:hypothetical protein